MNRFLALLAGILFGIVSSNAFAAGPGPVRLQECLHHKDQRTAAMQARDWNSMRVFASSYLKRCSTIDEPKYLASAYWEIAIADIELGRLPDALKSLDACIQVSYAYASCQVQKVYVLMRLRRMDEARELHQTASTLVASQLAAAERALAGQVGRDDRDKIENERESLMLNRKSLALYAENFE